MNAKSQVEIKGSYLKGAKVFVNNTEVKQLSNNDQTVTFDGNNYKNKTLNIKIQKKKNNRREHVTSHVVDDTTSRQEVHKLYVRRSVSINRSGSGIHY